MTHRETKQKATQQKSRMMAIVQDGYGKPEQVLRLDEIDVPTVGDDEVLVRMHATSVNTPDWITVAGIPYFVRLQAGLRRPRSLVRGSDVAGVVELVGENVTNLKAGDLVWGSWWTGSLSTPGTFAELSVGPASQLATKPAGLTFEEAGASVMSGLTALVAIRDLGRAGPGRSILINGASGGVGTFAIQIAKSFGAEVTGVCSTRNVALVESLGADHVVDYTKQDFTRGDRRYDVILDNVMNHRPSVTTRVLARGGTFIPNSVGDKGGLFAGLPRMAGAALVGLGQTDVRFAGDWVPPSQENLAALAELFESGAIKVVIDEVYPLHEAGRAVAHMLGHHARGNIVLGM